MAKKEEKNESGSQGGHFYVLKTCTDCRGEHHTQANKVRLSYDPETPYLRRISGHEYP